MRFLHGLLLASMLILTAGCSAPRVVSFPAPATNPAASVDVARLEAVNVALRIFEADGTRWLEPPQTALAEQMTYTDARKLLPMLSDPKDSPGIADLQVWLVVLRGQRRLLPYGQTQGEPLPTIYEGCVFVLFKAAGGDVVAMGDATCPGQM